MVALVVGFLGGSFMEFDLAMVVKKRRAALGFVLQVILGESICVSGPCTFQISCGTISKIA